MLGTLVFDRELECWTTKVDTPSGPIGFEIGGERAPDERLIAHAVDIVGRPAEFMVMVVGFLGTEAMRDPRLSGEIRQLTLESVCLRWPKHPDDGMLYFSSPDEDHLWRCDYVKRTPQGLGFDS